MRILQVSTYDIRGGAARATCRLQKGLREMGHDCRMLVRHKSSDDRYVHPIFTEPSREEGMQEFLLRRVIQEHCINLHRTEISNTLFSLPYPGYDIARTPAVNEAEIINLHWVAQFQSPVTLRNLCLLGKPVVWTLHDQCAFTGGCHYSAGCEKFQSDCSCCPQLSNDLCLLPGAILQDTLDFFKGIPVTFVSPSRWMADCLRKSRLFHDRRVEVIPNSLETDVFCPISKQIAKEALGLKEDTVTVLFGGEDANERRKGLSELISAVNHIRDRSEFKALIDTNGLCVLCFGQPSREFESMNLPVVALGYLGSDQEIRNAYCAADVFVLPSLEDNLPNTVLEAMSCGTPVVGFEIGGMPDMVENGLTGQLVPPGDAVQLGEAILAILSNSSERHEMGERCRKKIEAEYALGIQASRYVAFYEELLSEKGVDRLEGLGENHEPKFAFFGEDLSAVAPLEPTVGPHFEKVYDAVLFHALKESAFEIYRKWQDAESDRVRRFQVIREQGERITDLELQVDRWLNETKRLQDDRSYLLGEVDRWLNETKRLQDDRSYLLGEVDRWLNETKRLQDDRSYLLGEVDRWLNESRRLHEAYSEIERDRNELKIKTMRQGGRQLLKWLRREFSFLPDRLREVFLLLKGTRIMRFDPALSSKKTLTRDDVGASDSERNIRSQRPFRVELAAFKDRIDAFNGSQPNRRMLDDIRLFNHSMIDQFNSMFPLKGCILLDLGASPHGYALERALTYGVALYAGIGLDINDGEYVSGDGNSVGILLKMDAANLRFPDGMFDAVFSISVFEHVSDVPRVLSEIARVLRVGGCALISFEPVWSCSYGHHLHHFGECARLVPPWAHLIWSSDQMKAYLSERWPGNAPLLLDEAIEWVYHGDSINRLDVRQFKELFAHSGLTVKWCMNLKDDEEKRDSVQLKMASEATGLALDELMTKGLFMLLTKESSRA